MDVINESFFNGLVKYYMFQKKAKQKVFQQKLSFRYVLKVYKWRREMRASPMQIRTASSAVADLDRKKLWRLIVRRDIIQAHRRKVAFIEHKLLTTRFIAYRCQSYFKEFKESNNKVAKLD